MYNKFLRIYSFVLAFLPFSLILECYLSFWGSVNTFFFISMPVLIILMNKNKRKFDLTVLIISYILLTTSLLITRNISIHIHYIIDFLVITNNLMMISSKSITHDLLEEIKKYNNLLFIGVIVNFLLNIIVIIFGYGFSLHYSNSWNVKALCGIYVDPHQFAYKTSGILMMILFLIKYKKKNKSLLYIISLVFSVLVLMTAARVPTLFSAVIEILILSTIRLKVKIDNPNIKQVLIIIMIIVCIVGFLILGTYMIFTSSSFYDKLINTNNKNNFDNGRESLRKTDIMFFNQQNLFTKLLGSGAETTYSIHIKYHGMNIWSHNDFLQILISFGMIELMMYIVILFKYCINLKKAILFNFFILISLIFLAFYNGLFIHPRFVVALIFLSLYCCNEEKYISEKNEK